MASYTYDQDDFLASSSIDINDLQIQIQNSAISSSTLQYIDYEETGGGNFTIIIYFSGSLSGGDVTILNNLVAAYVTTPPPVIEETTVSTTGPAIITNKSLDTQTNFFIDLVDDTKKLAFDTASNTTNTSLTLASQTTADRIITFPDISDTVVTLTAMQTLTNKTLTNAEFNGTGNISAPSSSFYVNPTSTAISGANNYYFSYLTRPATSGSTTGSAYTLFVDGSPLGTITTPYAVYINGGKTYIGGSLQIPTGASAGYILQSDSTGNTSWAPPSMVSFADGTASLPGIAFSSQASTGFYRPASGQIGVSLTGAEYITFKTTGTDFVNGSVVNIGTTGTTSSLNVFGLIIGNNGLTITGDNTSLTTLSTSGLITANAGINVTNGQTVNVGTSGSISSLNVYGMADFLGTGSTTAASSTIYSNPASTVLSGASAHFFNYFNSPTTTVSTFTGTASTVFIAGAPTVTTGGTGFALNVNSGTSRLQAATCTTLTASALITANLGLTIANSQTLNVGTSGTANTVNIRGITNQFGRLVCTSIGNATLTSASVYIAPISTAVSGANNYFFTYLAQPATTGTTTGSAYTFYIANAPSGTITNPFAFYVAAGKSYIGGALQIPTGASSGFVLTSDSSGNASWGAAASGTVTSVALSVPSFLSVSGSPITTSGTLAVTLSGTALPILNGGTGSTTSTGSGSVVLQTSPSLITPDIDAAIGISLSVSGVVNSGSLTLTGSTSGVISILPQAIAGTYNFNLPISSGSAGQVLTSQGGGAAVMTWSTPTSGTVTSVAATVPTFLSISGSPITTSGTLAISLSGTALPITSGGTGSTTATGSGSVVLQTSPTLTTPNIGAATGISLSVSGSLTSTVSTGTAPLIVSSTTNVPNLNASSLNGSTFANPGPIGSSVASTGAFTNLSSSGISAFTGLGNSTSSSSTVYIAPSSTVASSANNYFFTHLAQPVMTGSTTGSAYTLYIENAPSGTITTPYAVYIASGKTYIGGSLQIPTGASNGFVLTSDASGNTSWTAASSGTVTSVAATVPTFLSISGSPITTSGTLAISLSGTALPISSGGTGSTTSTGSGSVVLQTSPTLTTPNIGAATGTSLSVTGNMNSASHTLTGSTSGVISILPQAVAGTYNFNLPISSGSVGQVLTSQGGGATAMTWSTPSSGTVTSVALTVPSFLSISGSPITTSGTLAISVSSSTGSGALVLQTSPTLTTPNIGAATGTSLSVTGNMNSASHTLTGSTSGVISILPQAIAGTYNFNLPISSGSAGQVLTSGGGGAAVMTWSTPSSGTVTSVAATVPTFLSISGSPITTSGTLAISLSGTALPITSGGTGSTTSTGSGSVVLQTSPTLTTPNIGAATGTSLSVTGNMNSASHTLTGSTSGVISILPQAIAGTYNFNLPISSGSAGQVLTSGGGGAAVMTWSTPSSGTVTSVAATVPTFLSISGSPITTSGTLAISLSGTALPITSGGTGSTTATGSGSVVLQTSPTLTAPNIGAATGTSLSVTGNMNSASHTLTGSTSGVISILPQAVAGTYNFNLPTSSGTAGQVLTSGGGGASPMTWSSAGSGTVTSVALSVPSFLSISGSPITTSGTLAVTLSGTALPILNGGTGSTTATGTGSVVLQTSPTLTTPNIGAATGSSLSVSGQLTSTVSTGTAPLVVSSTTNVANLNASSLNGATFASPGAIGSTVASTGAFTTLSTSSLLSANAGLTIANGQTLNVGTSGTTSIMNVYGRTSFLGTGTTTIASSLIYVNPASTALTGASTYYFTTFNAPTTTASSFTGTASTVSITGPPSVTTGGVGYALNATGNCQIANTNSSMKFITNAIGGSGSWIDLDTTGSSGIGTGGAGANAMIAYAFGAGNWFTDALAGDYCYRNGTGRILFGTSSGTADIVLSTAGYTINTKTTIQGTGGLSQATSAFQSAPAVTAMTGANDYFFNSFTRPTTSGSTTGDAYTVYIQNSPSGTITNPYALYVNTGKTYIGGALQIPTAATNKYVLQSDANGNATWSLPFIPNFSVNSTTSRNTTSTSAINIPDMTLTPNIAGTYYVVFQAVARVSNNGRVATFQLALNGTLVTNSQAVHNMTAANNDISVFSSAIISFNGTSDTVTARYFINNNTVTLPNLKTLVAIRLDD